MKILKITLALILATLLAQTSYAYIKLPHIFGSRMILQQKAQCPIWGWANPGEVVSVECSWGVNTQATTGVNGKWEVVVTTPSYGGPYNITFNASNSITLVDILIGDVYLACGDSNMSEPLIGNSETDTVIGGPEMARNASGRNIRFFGVAEKESFKDEDDCEGYWYTDNPGQMPYCSALAYFFAHKINSETGVPIAIITSSWGGSDAESWISEEYIEKIPEFSDRLAEYRESAPNQALLNNWIKTHPIVDVNKRAFHDFECARVAFDDSQWKTMNVPGYFDSDGNMGAFDGMVWMRHWVEIPEEWQEKQLILSLGFVDDMDQTFINGELVGEGMESGMYNVNRVYKIHPGLVRAGKMLIAVRVLDTKSAGGLPGRPELMKIYPEGEEENGVSLLGDWKYMPTGEYCDLELYEYNYKNNEFSNRPKVNVTLSNKTITSCFRGMLKPIMPFRIAGALWYHNESNVGRYEEYYKLMPMIAECWRSGFRSPNMKFYFWQSHPYDYTSGAQSQALREVQRRCLDVIPNSGMVCLLDLGRKESMNPCTKKDAADRMTLWALRDLYGKRVEVSGPLYQSMEVSKGSITLTFTHTTGGLVMKGESLTDFEICDNSGIYVPANAVIQGNKVVVSSPDISRPRNVRYAWKNWIAEPSLYNGAGLPASSFTTDKNFITK